MEKDTLIRYALLHLFEILQLEDKIEVLNSLYKENDIDINFKNKMKEAIQIFIYEKDNKVFVIADFKKSINKKDIYFLVFNNENNEWIIENNWKSPSIIGILTKIIKEDRLVSGTKSGLIPKEGKINNFNNEIGFIGKGTGNKIVLKTKHIGSSGRVNKGIVCPSAGVPKSTTIFTINKLNEFVSLIKVKNINLQLVVVK